MGNKIAIWVVLLGVSPQGPIKAPKNKNLTMSNVILEHGLWP